MFVKNEAGPMLDKVEGCRGLSVLVDRETGQCIATSSWENEATMLASDDQLRPSRDRGRDILGASMQVDAWEIAVTHRTHHGERCRVSWLWGDLDAMTETLRVGSFPKLEQTAGFLQRQPAGGPVCGPGVRDNGLGDPRSDGSESLGRRRHAQRTASDAGGEIVDVLEFDLAYAHLHVPEMA